MGVRVLMLGDIVGMPGVQAVQQLMDQLRKRWEPDVVVANGENAYKGSGLTPQLYHQLTAMGIDGLTLGDHVYKRAQITHVLDSQPNIVRPANLPCQAAGHRWMKLGAGPEASVYVLLVLGRIFTNMPVDDPFATVESILGQLPEVNPIVLVEVHAEATSEKQALAHYLDGRVAAVIGSHTHVPTADAQILRHGTAYLTDMGMCGPHDSILGRRVDRVLTHMTTGMHAPFDVAEGQPRINGVFFEVDPQTRHAISIERFGLDADPQRPPFVAEADR